MKYILFRRLSVSLRHFLCCFLLIRRIADHKIELHIPSSCVHFPVCQTAFASPIKNSARSLLRCRFLIILTFKPVKQAHLPVFFLRFTIGDCPSQPIHLPDIPSDDIRNGLVFLCCRFSLPLVPQIFLKGNKKIHSGDQQTVSLKFITIDSLKGSCRPCQPFDLIRRVLIHHPQLPVKNPNTVCDRNDLTGRYIVPTDQIGRFTAGDFQSPVIHISLPAAMLRKRNLLCRLTAFCKHIRPAEPRFIGKIIHLPANP